ncbi:hypothetical protein GE061_000229 [Apolygus lucorum]|uniref:Uncharacterized protein n=1 Tax=Apolygus lucorum TaxID=248454 RepID=A0A8S9Y501_APOLU|nr:hypothetical protein GE061_000229 [Apolygus lucorum]
MKVKTPRLDRTCDSRKVNIKRLTPSNKKFLKKIKTASLKGADQQGSSGGKRSKKKNKHSSKRQQYRSLRSGNEY